MEREGMEALEVEYWRVTVWLVWGNYYNIMSMSYGHRHKWQGMGVR